MLSNESGRGHLWFQFFGFLLYDFKISFGKHLARIAKDKSEPWSPADDNEDG